MGPRGRGIVNIYFRSDSRWRTAQDFQSLNSYNSAADCSISLKFVTDFDHVTVDTLQVFKVKVSKVKVTR